MEEKAVENEILLHVHGMEGRKTEDKITQKIAEEMPGIELIQVNAKKGTVSVTGGDLDQLGIIDIIESMGYHTNSQ